MAASTSRNGERVTKLDDIALELYKKRQYTKKQDSSDRVFDDMRSMVRSFSRKSAKGEKSVPIKEKFDRLLKSDAFQEEVVEKTRQFFIGRQEAEDEVIVDRIVDLAGGNDEALLFVITTDFKEPKWDWQEDSNSSYVNPEQHLVYFGCFKYRIVDKFSDWVKPECLERAVPSSVEHLSAPKHHIPKLYHTTHGTYREIQVYVNTLLSRGANPRTVNDDMETPLFLAVKHNYRGICSKLLDCEAIPHVMDSHGTSPLQIAIDNCNDNIASILIDYMPNEVVRKWFTGHDDDDAQFSLHKLLLNKMEKTTLAVLDCMVEPQPNSNMYRVYYDALESDSAGRPPDHRHFDQKCKTCFQLIAKSGNKTVAFHTAVRLLIRRKWKSFANRRYKLNLFQFLFTIFSLTFAAIVASGTEDPMMYKDPLQIFRAIFEVWTLLVVVFTFFLEINQFRKHRLDYWKDKFNWLDISSTTLLIAVLPLRIAEQNAQWYVYSIGYLLWTIRIFKYSTVFRNLGAYSLVLWKIIEQDITQFTVLFFVFLLTFSGAMVLSLRGENSQELFSETRDFWNTMFTGVRILIEAGPVVEDYIQYKTLSVILTVLFLFISCVVLLNLLIAQLSDTYQNVQQDAQRGLELNRAWIITRFELNSLFIWKSKESQYVPWEDIPDMFDTLEKWDSPPINQLSATIRDIDTSLESQKHTIMTIQNRQLKLETNLHHIKEQMSEILDLTKQLAAAEGSLSTEL